MPQEQINELENPGQHVFAPLYKQSMARPGRIFYFSRHGESENNIMGKIGGNSSLSGNGKKYAKLLATYLNSMEPDNLQVSYNEVVLKVLIMY